jgi:hypothetical protein
MRGMAGSRIPQPPGVNAWGASHVTGGPLGTNKDAADPATPKWFRGDTPGATGANDRADPILLADAGTTMQELIREKKKRYLQAGLVRENVNKNVTVPWASPTEKARYDADVQERLSLERQIKIGHTAQDVISTILFALGPELAPYVLSDLALSSRVSLAVPAIEETAELASFDEVLIGSSTDQMRRDAARIIRETPNHPLKFLLDESGNFKSSKKLTHAEMINKPDVVQMGHIVSKKSGEGERIMLQGAWENQWNAVTAEKARSGVYVQNTAVNIGGIAVDTKTALFWEKIGFLRRGTVSAAPRVP